VARFLAVLLFGILLVVSAPVEAASPWQNLSDPVFLRADSRELPEAAVMSLAQDSAGFLWVGTQGGLARYDGYHFRNFLPNPNDRAALPDGYLRALLPDVDGGLWIGSSSDGLVHFDAATETFHTWRPARTGSAGPRSGSVDALILAADGHLWVGGDGGLGWFDQHAGTFTAVTLATHGPQPVVWALHIDRSGTLWAGTQDGLYARTSGATAFTKYPLPLAGAAAPTIYSLYEDGAGRLWGGSVNALYDISPSRKTVKPLRNSAQNASTLAPGQQWSITEASPGQLWVGTDGAISIVDEVTLRIRRVLADPQNPGGLTSGRAVAFMRGSSGLIWVANHVGGLLLHNPMSTGMYEVSASRPDIGFGDKGAVAVAAVPGNRLWVGGFLGRLAELEPSHRSAPVIVLPNHAPIQSLLPERGNRLWIGTTTGLCRLQLGTGTVSCPATPHQLNGESIYALIQDDGRLLVGGSAGLNAENIATGTVARYPAPGSEPPFSNNQVRVLFIDRKHRLWIGTENGLRRIGPNGRIKRFAYVPGDPNSIGPGGMASLLEDRRGRIWAGANGGPLNVIDERPDGTTLIRTIGRAAGMPHENVDGLAEDPRGRIWASTDKGIALIDPDTLQARAFGLADGLTDGAFWASAVSQSSGGTIFFGGLDGITVIAPDAESKWDYRPPIVASAVRVGRHSLPAWSVNRGDATLTLPADQRDISVEFSSLDYSAPQALRYQYRLDGYDQEWIDADIQHRDANYAHLPPGSYMLHVRGTNRLGQWSDRVLSVGVRALPLWNETWWFRLLVALAIALIAYVAYRVRTAVLRRRQHELEETVTDRTRKLSEANTKLQEVSLSDPLTGLRNRRFLTQHLEADIALTLRRYDDWRADPAAGPPPEDADMLFFLVDLDYFKSVNDRFGHSGGDAVLVQMRNRLHEVFRESDFVVRWGGDEFLAVARGSRRSDAPAIAERMCQAVTSHVFALGGDKTVSGTVSVGYAAFPFVQSAPADIGWPQVVGLADHALYKAKQSGRNTWYGVAARPDADPDALAQRLELDADDAAIDAHLIITTRPEAAPAS
jgi:diguanylate cyclase (GGDEF)-like protein